MSNAYRSYDVLKKDRAAAVTQNTAITAISEPFNITGRGRERCRFSVQVSAATVAVAITITLQHSPDGGTTWVSTKTASMSSGAGFTHITLNPEVAADQSHLPLLPLARLCITTGAGDSCTLTAVRVYQ